MNTATIAVRIKLMCKQKRQSIAAVLLACELNKGFIYDLEKRDVSPSVDKIDRLANYFGCSVDYLLGRTEDKELHG